MRHNADKYFILAGIGMFLLLPVFGGIGNVLGVGYKVPMLCFGVSCAAIGYYNAAKG
jgi:hypothetical protein